MGAARVGLPYGLRTVNWRPAADGLRGYLRRTGCRSVGGGIECVLRVVGQWSEEKQNGVRKKGFHARLHVSPQDPKRAALSVQHIMCFCVVRVKQGVEKISKKLKKPSDRIADKQFLPAGRAAVTAT